MKAYTKFLFTEDFKPSFKAVIKEGCQYFTIGEGDLDHCDFLVKMFNIAIEKHDRETTADSVSQWQAPVAIPVADPTLGSMRLLKPGCHARSSDWRAQNRPINSLKADGTPRTAYGQSVTSLDTPPPPTHGWKYHAMCRCARCAAFRRQRNAAAKEKLETLQQKPTENYWPFGCWRD